MFRRVIPAIIAAVLLGGLIVPGAGSQAAGRRQWQSRAPMPTPRTRLAVVAGPDGRIYAIGGCDTVACTGHGGFQTTVEVYTPATNTWTAAAGLPYGRSDLAAVAGSDGRIYAIGGYNAHVSPYYLPLVTAYTPASNTWTFLQIMPTGRSGLAAVAAVDGFIYAFGGRNGGTTPLTVVEAYLPSTNTWTEMAHMEHPRYGMAAANAPDGRIDVIGGSNGNGALNTAQVFTPWLNTWDALPYLPGGGDLFPGAVVGTSGALFVIGGARAWQHPRKSVLVYGPTGHVWQPGSPLGMATESPGAVLGSDGHLYVIGGDDGQHVLGNVEML